MSKIYYTMIVYVDDELNLDRSIGSIFSATENVNKLVKLIVVDPLCTDEIKNIAAKWKRQLEQDHFCYIEASDEGIAEGYNRAIPEIRGTYVNFSLSSTWFDEGTLDFVRNIAEERERPKLISLSPWTVNEKDEYVQYKMSPICTEDDYVNIRFYRDKRKLHLYFHAYFIRTFLIKSENREMKFRPELLGDATMELLMELLAEWRGYVYLPKIIFHYTVQLEDNTSAFLDQHHEWWYNDSFANWILPFVKKWTQKSNPMEESMKVVVLYLVFARYNCNYNDRNKGILKDDKLDEFVKLTGEILKFIDNGIIFKKNKAQTFSINRSMRMLFLKIKADADNNDLEVVVKDSQLYAWIHHKQKKLTKSDILQLYNGQILNSSVFNELEQELCMGQSLYVVDREDKTIPALKNAYTSVSLLPLGKLAKEHIIFTAINYIDDKLEIDGIFSGGDILDRSFIKLKMKIDDQIFPVEYSEIYGLNKLFGVTYNRKYQFHVSVPALNEQEKTSVRFYFELNGEDFALELRSNTVHAHVRADIKNQYWKYDRNRCLCIVANKILRLYNETDEQLLIREEKYQKELTKRAMADDLFAAKALELRTKYFEIKQSGWNKRIWITFDKLYKAGDNGEYMYDYIAQEHKDIDVRYVIKPDSPDYERMLNKGDQLLVWGDDETMLITLLSEVIMTTHANVPSYTGFEKEILPYICDLFNATIVCIQHGLTTQDIAQFQNRLFDNLQLYLCASPNEIKNLSRPIYGFYDLDRLKLTGVARYDGLKNNDQRQILITPTWRRNIANANVAHMKKGHNEFFKDSEYYRIYNSLINDPTLIECAKETGYKVIYLLHPAASAQIDDFDRNDYVEIIPAAGDMNYEKILTESSLMITDYSGVQFDFAYMRKPILYYHPKSIPPHYEESEAYKYDRDSFGPIIDNHEELVQTLCEYMRNDCKTEEEYINRADKFFAYKDHENCRRVYEAIRELADNRLQ